MDLRYTKRDLGAVARAFYERLAAGEFCVSRCEACGRRSFPPREFCRSCGARAWSLEPHEGGGVLYAFTTQERAFRFVAPQVVGLVELDGGVGRGFGLIQAPYETLSIGARMRLDPVTTDDGWTLPAWSPRDEGKP